MKNYLNYIALIMICLITGLTFVACGSDDDDSPKGGNLVDQLQGTWYFSLIKINVMGQTIEMDINDIKDSTGYGKFKDDVLTFSGEKVNGSYYTVDGNKILLPWYKDAGWWGSISFSGSKMIMYYDIVDQGVPMKMWVTYIKSRSGSMPESEGEETPLIINSVFDSIID